MSAVEPVAARGARGRERRLRLWLLGAKSVYSRSTCAALPRCSFRSKSLSQLTGDFMKRVMSALASGAALAWSGAAAAAVIDYSALVDLDPSMFQAAGSLIVPLTGGPIDIAVGDTLQGTITFTNGGRVTVFNGSLDGRERIWGTFSPDIGTTAFSTGSLQLLGIQGDYLGPATITSIPVNGAIGFAGRGDLTNTSFSFSGITFSIEYIDESTEGDFPLTTHVTPSFLSFPFETVIISESVVPEPATWAIMILGFGAAGSAFRRRRRIATAA